MNDKIKLYHGDCLEVMDKLIAEGAKVDLTVTSPPYDNLRTYNNSLEWNENIWKKVIEKLYEITGEGGVVVWIVGDATIKGSETGTSFKQALYFKEVGFNLHDTMIWQKISPFQHKNRYISCFEYMFVFSKGILKIATLIKDRKNKWAGTQVHGTQRQVSGKTKQLSEFQKRKKIKEYGSRYNIWDITPVKTNRGESHPAVFPEQLANDHIISWSNKNDIVFDPFMGSGTTGKMAKINNRKFIGIEKEKEYFNIAVNRIEKVEEENKIKLF